MLVTDQHMPGAADGFTLVSAMRSAQPDALTVVTSATLMPRQQWPPLFLQGDRILVEPLDVGALGELIPKRVAIHRGSTRTLREAVATILKREVTSITATGWSG